jgi:hypothetical protein
MRTVLVVANQSLGSADLADLVRERIIEDECEFTLLVPATVASDMSKPLLSATQNMPGASSDGDEYDAARARLAVGVKLFHQLGATVDGDVGDPDPLHAIRDMLSHRQFDEIILSTLPSGASRWLHQDLPHKIDRKFHLPVTVVTAGTAPGR